MTERRKTESASRRRTTLYRIASALSIAAQPLPIAGLFAVYTADGPSTRVDYCEPVTGRCSCGAPSGSCPHIAAVAAMTSAATAALVAAPRHHW